MKQFITKHERSIVGVLSGWDRIRFRGTIRNLAVTRMMASWLMDQRVMLKHFKSYAMGLTESVKASVEQVATSAGQSIKYLASSALSKEDLVQELIRREGAKDGLVCILSCVEPCRPLQTQTPVSRWEKRPKRFVDPSFVQNADSVD